MIPFLIETGCECAANADPREPLLVQAVGYLLIGPKSGRSSWLTTIPTRRGRPRFWKLPKILGRSLSPGFSGQAIEFLHILRVGIVPALLSERGKKLFG